MSVSRRKFLHLAGLSASALLFPLPPDEAPPLITGLGRATRTLTVFDRPSFSGNNLGYIRADAVFNLFGSVPSQDERYPHDWHPIKRGYVYSGFVQPVKWQRQIPSLDLPEKGFLGEITVPFASARAWFTDRASEIYRLYYGTTYWIGEARPSEDNGAIWYRVNGERNPDSYWVRGEHVRRITPEELTPISPEVTNKRIEVDLEHQTFRCYEGETMVLDALCSTGVYLRNENGKRIYGTPAGDWAIMRKRPSRHMAGDDGASADFFDLPGVPWVSYFHWWGTAVHGTYWHNDFGVPHSHGCLNLPSETAKWVFRWTLPQAGLEEQTLGDGTPLVVF